MFLPGHSMRTLLDEKRDGWLCKLMMYFLTDCPKERTTKEVCGNSFGKLCMLRDRLLDPVTHVVTGRPLLQQESGPCLAPTRR
jgi:hypothetical protein